MDDAQSNAGSFPRGSQSSDGGGAGDEMPAVRVRLLYAPPRGVELTGQEMVVVREVLEGMLAPRVAHAVLFDALDQVPTPPKSADQWLSFAKGPLQDVVGQRVGTAEAGPTTTTQTAQLRHQQRQDHLQKRFPLAQQVFLDMHAAVQWVRLIFLKRSSQMSVWRDAMRWKELRRYRRCCNPHC